MNISITDSFKKDFADICRKELEDVGFVTSSISDKDIAIRYFTIFLRLIVSKPRKIVKSKDFSCPCDLQKGLSILEEKIVNGYSLLPHQSKSIIKLSTEDLLLYTWSIHHFHLGESVESDGFIKRTGPVLFAYVTDDTFYMIGIKNHGTWSDKNLIQTIYDNWPNLLQKWKIDGQPVENLDSVEIGKLRKCHVNTLVQLKDGSSFIGPGRGITTAGSPLEATMIYNNILRDLYLFVDGIKNNPTSFLKEKYSEEEIEKMNESRMDLCLKEKGNNLIIISDRISGIYVPFFERNKILTIDSPDGKCAI